MKIKKENKTIISSNKGVSIFTLKLSTSYYMDNNKIAPLRSNILLFLQEQYSYIHLGKLKCLCNPPLKSALPQQDCPRYFSETHPDCSSAPLLTRQSSVIHEGFKFVCLIGFLECTSVSMFDLDGIKRKIEFRRNEISIPPKISVHKIDLCNLENSLMSADWSFDFHFEKKVKRRMDTVINFYSENESKATKPRSSNAITSHLKRLANSTHFHDSNTEDIEFDQSNHSDDLVLRMIEMGFCNQLANFIKENYEWEDISEPVHIATILKKYIDDGMSFETINAIHKLSTNDFTKFVKLLEQMSKGIKLNFHEMTVFAEMIKPESLNDPDGIIDTLLQNQK